MKYLKRYSNNFIQIIRINVNIAIVDMISPEYKGNTSTSSECFELANTTVIMQNSSLDNSEKYVSFERKFLDYFNVSSQRTKITCFALSFSFTDWVWPWWFQVGRKKAERGISSFLYCSLGNSITWWDVLFSIVMKIKYFISIKEEFWHKNSEQN